MCRTRSAINRWCACSCVRSLRHIDILAERILLSHRIDVPLLHQWLILIIPMPPLLRHKMLVWIFRLIITIIASAAGWVLSFRQHFSTEIGFQPSKMSIKVNSRRNCVQLNWMNSALWNWLVETLMLEFHSGKNSSNVAQDVRKAWSIKSITDKHHQTRRKAHSVVNRQCLSWWFCDGTRFNAKCQCFASKCELSKLKMKMKMSLLINFSQWLMASVQKASSH